MMRILGTAAALAAWMGFLAMGLSGQELKADAGPSAKAAAALEFSLAAAEKDKDDVSSLYEGLLRAAAVLGPDSRHGAKMLDAVVASRGIKPKERRARLAKAAKDHWSALSFRPVMSADRPTGWPTFTTVGEIEVKRYPKYRMARASMDGRRGEMSSFWTLFNHIKKNDIAMTAPVETSYVRGEDAEPEAQTMAFLYGDKAIGKAGSDGKVDVVDVPEQTVVSMGARGYDRRGRVQEMERELEGWLKARPDWKRGGATRVMGWNGPRVQGQRRYFEVQIPVIRVKKATSKAVERSL